MFNKNIFRKVLLFLILAEVLSIFGWALPVFNLVCFLVILLLTLVLSLKKLAYGIFIAIAELIIGSHGYLFSFELGSTLVSIRIGIFGVVMLAWLIHVLRYEGFVKYWQRLKEFKFFKYYVALAVVLVWGFVWGIIRNNFGNVFLDFNNWLFFLYLLPLIDVARHKEFWQDLVQVVLAALSWLIIKTLLLLYIFSHQFIWALPEVYQWIRDTRVGEITMMSNNFYRIFIQSQIYALLGFFIFLPMYCKIQDTRDPVKLRNGAGKIQKRYKFQIPNYSILLICCLATVIISFSRSFWTGLAAGLFVYCLLLIVYWRKKFFNQILKLVIIAVISLAVIFIVINFPPKISGQGLGSLISKRTTQIEAAGSSRINMLKPLGQAIIQHPLVGSGFGTTVTYRSVDPRVLLTTAGASGEYTTYAFEWAYLDLLLKVGLVGLVVYLLLIFKLLQALWQQAKLQITNYKLQINAKCQMPNANYLPVGILLALISLLAVNIFTPYLNHPLGIGFIILTSVFLNHKSYLPAGPSADEAGRQES